MQRLIEIPKGESITACIYGSAGSGKTWMMGTAGDRTVYCDIENRLSTLQSSKFKEKFKFNPILIRVHEEPLPDGGAKALVELTAKINKVIEENSDDFDHIIIDGATALRRFAMNMGLEINQKLGKSKSLNNPAISSIVKDFPYASIGVQDYGIEMSLIEKFIISMKEYCSEAKKHFWLTAHERIEYNKPSAIGDIPTVRSVKPGFTGQTFPDSIPGMFDLVWHTETKGGGERTQYFARTEGDSGLVAKSCIGGFKTQIENPNILEITKRIQNG